VLNSNFFKIFCVQGLSLVLTVLFRFLAGAMIWLLLVALVLGSFGGTSYLW
jgi:solute carrier family 44 protein 1 (choline transporter-like protein)